MVTSALRSVDWVRAELTAVSSTRSAPIVAWTTPAAKASGSGEAAAGRHRGA